MLRYLGEIRNPRRHALIKRIAAAEREDTDYELIWQAKQASYWGGLTLPTDFPFRARLAAIGYTVAEDLDGASEDELMGTVSLTRAQAKGVLAALELL